MNDHYEYPGMPEDLAREFIKESHVRMEYNDVSKHWAFYTISPLIDIKVESVILSLFDEGTLKIFQSDNSLNIRPVKSKVVDLIEPFIICTSPLTLQFQKMSEDFRYYELYLTFYVKNPHLNTKTKSDKITLVCKRTNHKKYNIGENTQLITLKIESWFYEKYVWSESLFDFIVQEKVIKHYRIGTIMWEREIMLKAKETQEKRKEIENIKVKKVSKFDPLIRTILFIVLFIIAVIMSNINSIIK